MPDESLRDQLRDLVIQFLRSIEVGLTVNGRSIPHRQVPHVDVQANGSMSFDTTQEPDFGTLAGFTLLDFMKDSGNLSRIQVILEQPEVSKLLSDKGVAVMPMAFAYNVLQPLIVKQLYAQRGVDFDESSFDSNYRAFEDYLRSSTDSYVLTAPLRYFSMESEEERVGPFAIRRLARDEFALYNGITTDPSSLIQIPPDAMSRFALDLDVMVPRGSTPLTSETQDRFWWCVAVMKLLKPGTLGYNWIWVRPTGWTGMSFSAGSGRMLSAPIGNPYRLARADLSTLHAYWNFAEPLIGKEPPFWFTALHRFSDAVNRARADEALVDYWIACESLFGEDVEHGELTYRLSLRIAHFLESDPDSRERLRASVKHAYRVRGQLLHGSRRLNPQQLLNQARVMEEVTRRSLQKCLIAGLRSRTGMIESIEKSIVGRSNPVADSDSD